MWGQTRKRVCQVQDMRLTQFPRCVFRGSRLRPVNNEPPEPDQAPDLATLNPSLPATRPDDPHKLMHHDLYATHQPLASGYADDWAAPTSPSPSSYAYAPHSSPYAPAQPGGAASPPLDAVVMSNFPRQQVGVCKFYDSLLSCLQVYFACAPCPSVSRARDRVHCQN